ncbi:MAG: GGDEF domain-containing protein [Elusimicrobia bacterium]|nr:GGDEF domain-containing protein [Elusimicrobiota bacterium]
MGWPIALASLAPAACLFASYPRQTRRAGVFLGVTAALCASLWLREPGPAAALAAGWSVLGSAAAAAAVWRNARDHARQAGELEAVCRKRRELAAALTEVKRRGTTAEREQKETLALYGMIKSLADALKWTDIKPKLESAVDQVLGLTDYALFAADPQAKGSFKLLAVHRLEGSPGSSWATLQRCLQEQGLELGRAQSIEAPERAVVVPIADDAEVLGYFYARAAPGADPAALLSKTAAFASQVSFAFRRIRLFQEVENLSQIDGLTGVYRRGGFDDRLEREAVRAKTFKTTFGLMLLDIDHFKQLNDRYGHPFGDQVLKRVGEILNVSVYDTDFVARYGGEEFVVLLPRAQAEGAARKAEAIRRAVEAEKFQLGFETVKVTVSIGIAHFPRDAAAPDELVAEADAAMYEAKSRGRNQVVDSWSMRHSS